MATERVYRQLSEDSLSGRRKRNPVCLSGRTGQHSSQGRKPKRGTDTDTPKVQES